MRKNSLVVSTTIGLLLLLLPLVPGTAGLPPRPPATTAQSPDPRATAAPALPLVRTAATAPVLPALRTPRARIVLGVGSVSSSDIRAHNWRLGMSYLLRANLPGIVEYLFPFDGIFRNGQPLARVYNIGNITDWEKARELLVAAGASPYLIAGRPPTPQIVFPSAMAPVSGQPAGGLPVFSAPSPAARAVEAPARASLARAPSARTEAVKPRASLARTGSEAEPATQDVVTYESVPGQKQDYSGEMGKAQERVAAANEDVGEARRIAKAAQEDLDARSRLYQDGLIARREVDNARARVDEARRSLSAKEEALNASKQGLREVQSKADTPAPATTRRVVRRVPVPRATLAASPTTPQPQAFTDAAPAASPTTTEPRRVASTPQPAATPASRRDSGSRVIWPSPVTAGGQTSGRGRAGVSGGRPQPGAPMTPLSPMANQMAQMQIADQNAPSDGVLVRAISPNGALVQAGDPLLEVASTEWVRLYADITLNDVPRFQTGTPVTVSFDDYPGVRFAGWVGAVTQQKTDVGARAELIVFCERGMYRDDARFTVEWLALASPLEDEAARGRAHPLDPVPDEGSHQDALARVFPVALPSDRAADERDEDDRAGADVYAGALQLGEMPRPAGLLVNRDTTMAQKRLSALRVWRDAFNRGMMTTTLAPGVALTFPRDGEVNYAIERMLGGAVSHIPNRCAGTMREALGWGLGDAHEWATGLPQVGYAARPPGLARPGDILVWPFTYGPRATQHIGFAVQQNGRLMLLSNLGGYLGTTEILPGFIAYYRPAAVSPTASAQR